MVDMFLLSKDGPKMGSKGEGDDEQRQSPSKRTSIDINRAADRLGALCSMFPCFLVSLTGDGGELSWPLTTSVPWDCGVTSFERLIFWCDDRHCEDELRGVLGRGLLLQVSKRVRLQVLCFRIANRLHLRITSDRAQDLRAFFLKSLPWC